MQAAELTKRATELEDEDEQWDDGSELHVTALPIPVEWRAVETSVPAVVCCSNTGVVDDRFEVGGEVDLGQIDVRY